MRGSRAALSSLDAQTLREVGLYPGQVASAPAGLNCERLRGPWHVCHLGSCSVMLSALGQLRLYDTPPQGRWSHRKLDENRRSCSQVTSVSA